MRLPAACSAVAQRGAATLLAAVLLTSSPLRPPALAAPPPTTSELSRLSFGLARIDFLLENWDRLTTVCNGVSTGTAAGALEDAQVMRTQNQNRCYKTPLKVQQFIGASSTLDPLFKADKLMIRAQPLVRDENQEAYTTAVDAYITKQQMSSTMAYTSSWSGIENPNGSVEQARGGPAPRACVAAAQLPCDRLRAYAPRSQVTRTALPSDRGELARGEEGSALASVVGEDDRGPAGAAPRPQVHDGELRVCHKVPVSSRIVSPMARTGAVA